MKVAIVGYGAEGQSSYRYFSERGDDVTIVAEKISPLYPIPEGARSIVGDGAFQQLNGFDLLLRTPPMRPDSIVTDGKVWSQANEFVALCPAPIIGVTGTKGKGTTSSLIAEILRASGKTVHLIGNIGRPPLDVLDDIAYEDVVVYEMSSFQLWDLETSPRVAVVLMIEPDHMDIHATMEEYVAAKANIVRHQSGDDIVFYHPTNEYSRQIAEQSPAEKFCYATNDEPGVYVEDGQFKVGSTVIAPVEALQIPGAHNVENACAAISAALVAGAVIDNIEAGLRAFTGLDHRLKHAGVVNGINFYDDSIATTVGSAIAAIAAFAQPKTLILGGSDKGADYAALIDECKTNEVKVVAIGKTGETIATLCHERGVDVVRVEGLMDTVVAAALDITPTGGVVILSPASASFDQYDNYAARGDAFIAAVRKLA
jgi:UDP-N-acetylmuramoylalanine--D-glutamate ligase